MKQARGNMSGSLASYRREKDVPGALICLKGDLAGHCLIIVKYPTGGGDKSPTPAGPSIW